MDTTAGSLWMEPKNIMENKEIFLNEVAAAGYGVVRLSGKFQYCPNGRTRNHGWTSSPGNYGIVLNRETLVVDIDPRNAKGANVLHRLVLDCPGLKRCH